MRIFLFLFGKFKYFAILRQYRAAAGVDDRLFFHSDGLRDIFLDETILNFDNSKFFLTFVSEKRKHYVKRKKQNRKSQK